jgi:hypothetical protein
MKLLELHNLRRGEGNKLHLHRHPQRKQIETTDRERIEWVHWIGDSPKPFPRTIMKPTGDRDAAATANQPNRITPMQATEESKSQCLLIDADEIDPLTQSTFRSHRFAIRRRPRPRSTHR